MMRLSTDYSQNKYRFLTQTGYSESNVKSFMKLYEQYILKIERENRKDLGHFKIEDIDKVIESISVLNKSKVDKVKTFIREYFNYLFLNGIKTNYTFGSKEFIALNPITDIFYIGISDFYKVCIEMLRTADMTDIIPLVLARYGIVGNNLQHMRNLRWTDIDVINLEVVIKEGNEIIKYIIDEKFVRWMYLGRCDIHCNNEYVILDNNRNNKNLINENKDKFTDLCSYRMMEIIHNKVKGMTYFSKKEVEEELSMLFVKNMITKKDIMKLKKQYCDLRDSNIKVDDI